MKTGLRFISKKVITLLEVRCRSIIDILPLVKTILEKYDYKLDRYGNTLFNRYLSESLEKSGMFNEIFYKKKRIKGRPIQLPGISRYKALSTHSGRRTCITNLISNGHALARIRTISGHSSDRMLLRYYDAFRQNNSDNSDLTRSLDSRQNTSQKNNLGHKMKKIRTTPKFCFRNCLRTECTLIMI